MSVQHINRYLLFTTNVRMTHSPLHFQDEWRKRGAEESFTGAWAEGREWPTPPAAETGDHYSQGELYRSRSIRRRAAHSSSSWDRRSLLSRWALQEQEQKKESDPLLQQLRQEIITLKVSFTRAGAEEGEWPTPPAAETGDHYLSRWASQEQEQKKESGPLLQQLRQEIITLKVSFAGAAAEGRGWPTPPAGSKSGEWPTLRGAEVGDYYLNRELIL